MSAIAFPFREEPAMGRSAALSATVHLVLLAVMVFGIRWQSHRPDVVEVELWEPAPVVQPAPPPPPQAAPAPPKVEPAPPPVPKPDIAVREKPKPKPEPKAKPKAEPKKAPPPKPKADPEVERRLREQLAMEQKAREAQQREQALQQLLARQQADAKARELDARARGLATWQDKIRSKIRGNIVLPQDVAGNPEAIFDVSLLPTGEVLLARKRKGSGHAGYDEAVERAILKSSPLPKPDNPALFERQLELRFRPQDR